MVHYSPSLNLMEEDTMPDGLATIKLEDCVVYYRDMKTYIRRSSNNQIIKKIKQYSLVCSVLFFIKAIMSQIELKKPMWTKILLMTSWKSLSRTSYKPFEGI
ncbi:hypothetical protein RF11_11819 [Thelohanellus kitauei]|uniref:Uncharacterized protein n=1 Tax=Thelohanellus kitauei TaxID=669202 RepID=A0A0C2N5Q8_THEKT|nr:hypothetical protein RF11_11819 [Thelohanellus kitauei]